MYPQALVATLGAVSVLVVVLVTEALSLLFLLVVSYEERQVARKQEALLRALGGGDLAIPSGKSRMLFWTYVCTTALITVVTTTVFLYQPHLL